jgi:hypothetical protein
LEALKQKVAQTLSTSNSVLGKAFQEAGIAPESGEAMAELMEQVGLTPEHFKDRLTMGEFLVNMVQGLSPEMRGQFKNLMERWAGGSNLDSAPPEIAAILSQLAGK